MLKSKHHKIIYPLFKVLTRFLLKRNFHSISIDGTFSDNGNSVFVIANHISWWDGFWIMFLNLKLIHRKFHFMMLENQLKKHWYFQYAGGYSINKKSKSMVESINYTIELLKHKENMVFMFPQGQINSMHNDKIKFEKGVERVIRKIQPETQVLFVANLIDYFSDPKPNLTIYIELSSANRLQQSKIESEYNKFYIEVLQIQKSKTS